ncbi:MAG: hypothetical protein K2J20_00300, partial [Bacilli bacterium]|nr:hypothetical protein [Bacilli bacterium]
YEVGHITKETLYEVIKDIYINKKIYLSKELKDLSIENFFINITEYMEKYYFIRKVSNYYEILPTIRLFIGKLTKKEEEITLFGSDENV